MNDFGWTILDTGINRAEKNMEIDVSLLEGLDVTSMKPVLHLYDWKSPSATYGYFIDPFQYLTNETAEYLELARRPTGGGVILHTDDFAFSILVPAAHPAYSVNTLENYAFVNYLLIEVIRQFAGQNATLGLLMHEPQASDMYSKHFCMAKPTKYDVMIDGRKVGGGAQRRTRSGFLHQGTLSLALPDVNLLQRILLPDTCVFRSMQQNSYALLEGSPTSGDLSDARSSLKEIFKKIIL